MLFSLIDRFRDRFEIVSHRISIGVLTLLLQRGPTGLDPKPELLSYITNYESISYADSLPLSQAIEPPPTDGSNPPFPLLHAASGSDRSLNL